MKNSAFMSEERKSHQVLSYSGKASIHIDRLKGLINKKDFGEEDINKVVKEINALCVTKDNEAKELIESYLLDFTKEVPWYSSDKWITHPIGVKEIGYEVRLASIQALERMGDRNSIPKLRRALTDCGDRNWEFGEVRCYPYRDGDKIRVHAAKVLDKLEARFVDTNQTPNRLQLREVA